MMRCGKSSAILQMRSEILFRTALTGWLRREKSCGMMGFHLPLGVVSSPACRLSCNSRACFTVSCRRRSVAVIS